jgi:hypothetical protein
MSDHHQQSTSSSIHMSGHKRQQQNDFQHLFQSLSVSDQVDENDLADKLRSTLKVQSEMVDSVFFEEIAQAMMRCKIRSTAAASSSQQQSSSYPQSNERPSNHGNGHQHVAGTHREHTTATPGASSIFETQSVSPTPANQTQHGRQYTDTDTGIATGNPDAIDLTSRTPANLGGQTQIAQDHDAAPTEEVPLWSSNSFHTAREEDTGVPSSSLTAQSSEAPTVNRSTSKISSAEPTPSPSVRFHVDTSFTTAAIEATKDITQPHPANDHGDLNGCTTAEAEASSSVPFAVTDFIGADGPCFSPGSNTTDGGSATMPRTASLAKTPRTNTKPGKLRRKGTDKRPSTRATHTNENGVGHGGTSGFSFSNMPPAAGTTTATTADPAAAPQQPPSTQYVPGSFPTANDPSPSFFTSPYFPPSQSSSHNVSLSEVPGSFPDSVPLDNHRAVPAEPVLGAFPTKPAAAPTLYFSKANAAADPSTLNQEVPATTSQFFPGFNVGAANPSRRHFRAKRTASNTNAAQNVTAAPSMSSNIPSFDESATTARACAGPTATGQPQHSGIGSPMNIASPNTSGQGGSDNNHGQAGDDGHSHQNVPLFQVGRSAAWDAGAVAAAPLSSNNTASIGNANGSRSRPSSRARTNQKRGGFRKKVHATTSAAPSRNTNQANAASVDPLLDSEIQSTRKVSAKDAAASMGPASSNVPQESQNGAQGCNSNAAHSVPVPVPANPNPPSIRTGAAAATTPRGGGKDYSGRAQHMEALTQEAKEAYTRGDYKTSIRFYTDAVALLNLSPFQSSPQNSEEKEILSSLFGNRAAALLMVGAYHAAVSDCHKAVHLVRDLMAPMSTRSRGQQHQEISFAVPLSKYTCRLGRAYLKMGEANEAQQWFFATETQCEKVLGRLNHVTIPTTEDVKRALTQMIGEALQGTAEVNRYHDCSLSASQMNALSLSFLDHALDIAPASLMVRFVHFATFSGNTCSSLLTPVATFIFSTYTASQEKGSAACEAQALGRPELYL